MADSTSVASGSVKFADAGKTVERLKEICTALAKTSATQPVSFAKHKASNNNKKQQVSQYFATPALYCG